MSSTEQNIEDNWNIKKNVIRMIIEKMDRRTVLALLATQALIAITIILLFKEIPKEGRDVLTMLIGALVILVKDAYSYDFNTTASSASKDDTIKEVLTNKEQKQ